MNKGLLFVATASLLNACFQTTCGVVTGHIVYYFIGAAFLIAATVLFVSAWTWR